MPPPNYGSLTAPSFARTSRSGLVSLCLLGGAALVALAALAASQGAAEGGIVLSGVIGNDAGPSSRWEGSNAMFGMPTYSNDAMNAKEQETGFGVPGQLGTGPDYYSTANWDNAEVYPSLMNSKFDPYVGPGGCPSCKGPRKTYMFSVDPRCDGSYQCRNIRKILKLDQWSNEAAFQAAIYKEKSWIGNQAGFFIGESKDVVMVVPPCFFPPLANTELNALNDAIYGLGGSILVLGGLPGANFISQNLRGKDGHGYVDSRTVGGVRGSTYAEDSPKFTMDCVWSGGPFVLQNAAVNTEFFYGPRFLEGTESTWGIPVNELPPETIHYYMSADQISVVFEIPAGNGRIMFMGYDFGYMAPHWMEALMLARRELQIDAQYPAGGSIQFKQLPKPGQSTAKLGHLGAAQLRATTTSTVLHADAAAPVSSDVQKDLPTGADGDAIDVEIAKAVDRLEVKMKHKLQARSRSKPRTHIERARGAKTARTQKKLATNMAQASEPAQHQVAGQRMMDRIGDDVMDIENTADGHSTDDGDVHVDGHVLSSKRYMFKQKHAQQLHSVLPRTPLARGSADEWLETDAKQLV